MTQPTDEPTKPERRVDSIHIGNVETGIIVTWDDGTLENLPMTERCYKERQQQAESVADHHFREGALSRGITESKEARSSDGTAADLSAPEGDLDPATMDLLNRALVPHGAFGLIKTLIAKSHRTGYEKGWAECQDQANEVAKEMEAEAREEGYKEGQRDALKDQPKFIATVFEQLGIDRLTLTNRAKVNASTRLEMWDDMDGTHYLLHKELTQGEDSTDALSNLTNKEN